MEMIRQDKQKN